MRAWALALVLLGSVCCLQARAMDGSGRSSSTPEPNLDADKMLGKVAGWSLAYNQSLDGCIAAATYHDGTTVWMGAGGENKAAFLAFTNPRWSSIRRGRKYELTLTTSERSWKGPFTGIIRDTERGLFARGLKQSFVSDIARARDI